MTRAMHRILIVEDDPGIRSVLRLVLTAEQYRVVEAETAERGEIEARSHQPDLVVVDLGLPDRDGLDLIRRIRAWSPMPIVVLSARTAEMQKVTALDAGADDFITKPFGTAELLARVRAALRRVLRGAVDGTRLRLGQTTVDFATRSAVGPSGDVHLTPLEFRVLECLAATHGLVATQQRLLREAWGPGRDGDSRALRVCIRNLRAKLEADPTQPRYLLTEAGVGYRLLGDTDLTLPDGANTSSRR